MNTDRVILLNSEELSKVFYYDPSSSTGLRWKVWNRAYGKLRRDSGDEAGKKYFNIRDNSKHMIRVGFSGKLLAVHRVIWVLEIGPIPNEYIIDHKDGDPFNNNLDNLRCIHSHQNSRNAKKRKDITTGITGVYRIHNGTGSYYIGAGYYDENKKFITKQWPLLKYSEQEAIEFARLWREDQINKMKELGYEYTERHGN